MKLSISVLALTATSALAVSNQLIKNYCNETLYLTLGNSSGVTDGPFALPTMQAWTNNIVGESNTCAISKSADIWSQDTAKLILGTTIDNGYLYWSVSNMSGDPFAGEIWDLTSSGTAPDVCGSTDNYQGEVYTCLDNDVTLLLSAC